jgi:hypothetical protein
MNNVNWENVNINNDNEIYLNNRLKEEDDFIER